MMRGELTVAARLGASFALLILTGLIMTLFSRYQLGNIGDQMRYLVDDQVLKYVEASQVANDINSTDLAARNLLLLSEDQGIAEQKAHIDKVRANINEVLEKLHAQSKSSEGQALLEAVIKASGPYNAALDKAITWGLQHKNVEARDTLLGEVNPLHATMQDSLSRFLLFQREQMRKSADQVQQNVAATGMLTLFFAGLASIASAALTWLITRWLSRQLGGEPGYAANVAREIAGGNLAVDVHLRAGDSSSMLAAMRDMRDSLAEVVVAVRQGSEAVASASAQIAQGNMDLSARTESQAGFVEETAASMEQLGSTVKQNADSAQQADVLARNASEVAVRGGEVVAQVVETMKGINDSAKMITDIIAVIESIAFQTNILALNAAVEAARAGELGRGFAVVAGEVRALAGRSAEAAKEIKGLITDSVERIEQGTQLVDQAGNTITEVVDSIQRVTDIMMEISAASSEQSVGVAQVGEAVSQIDQATQQNAALVEESAAAAENLKARAQELVKAVATFKLSRQPVDASAMPALE